MVAPTHLLRFLKQTTEDLHNLHQTLYNPMTSALNSFPSRCVILHFVFTTDISQTRTETDVFSDD